MSEKDKNIGAEKYRKKTRAEKKEFKENKKRAKADAKAQKKAAKRARQDENEYMRVINQIRDGFKVGMKGIMYTLLALGVFALFVTIGITGFATYKAMPIIKEAKATSYDKLNSIGPNTFQYLENTTIQNNRGEIIGEIKKGNYEYVESEAISKWVKEGYIAVEDKNFKTHNGIDLKALSRAGVALVKNKGKITQGGSTITQQVVKNALLSQEQTYKRKIVEVFLAPELEKQHSKNKILEYYVNTNFYANNCYGVGTASKYYFGKPAKDLEPQEAAILIALSNNPAKYNPKKNPEASKDRRDWVLSVMRDDGVLTDAEYTKAKNTELEMVFDREVGETEAYTVSYAIHDTVLGLMRKEGFKFKYVYETEEEEAEYKAEYTERYRNLADTVRAGGYTIYTSIDNEKQDMLQEIIDKQLSPYKEKQENGKYAMQGSAVIVDNQTGMVEAIVGGRGATDLFNRAFLGVRQPGSAIKPFVVYGPAYDTGRYYPSKIVKDEAIKGGPKNAGSGYRGNMTMREAHMRSTNTVAFKVLVEMGAKVGLNHLGKMEFASVSHLDNYNGAVALGGFTRGATSLEMTKAMSTLVTNGEYNPSGCVTKVEFQNEGVVFTAVEQRPVKVYEPDTAYMVIDGMKDVITGAAGTGKAMAIDGIELVGKTGTTNDQKDTWFVGASPQYSVTVWAGYDIPKNTGKYGSTLAGPIWKEVMENLHEGVPKGEDFERPITVIEGYVDSKGNLTSRGSGRKDLFSQILIDKGSASRNEAARLKREQEQKIIIETVGLRIKSLGQYKIRDKKDVSYVIREQTAITSEIDKIDEAVRKSELQRNLDEIMEVFKEDIEIYRAEIEIEEKLNAERYQEELIRTTEHLILDLDFYMVRNTGSVQVVDNKVREIKEKLEEIKDDATREELERELEIVEITKEREVYRFRIELEESGILEQEEIEKEERIQQEIEKAREAEIQKIRDEQAEKERLEREEAARLKREEQEKKEQEERQEQERQEAEEREREQDEEEEKERP